MTGPTSAPAVLAGEISAHAHGRGGVPQKAARYKTTTFDQIKTLILKANLSDDERAELVALLTSDRRAT